MLVAVLLTGGAAHAIYPPKACHDAAAGTCATSGVSGMVEFICDVAEDSEQKCGRTIEVQLCPPHVCDQVTVFLNAWYIKPVDGADRFKRVRAYVKLLSYAGSTGVGVVELGVNAEVENSREIEVGLNWASLSHTWNEVKLTAGQTTCIGSTDQLCSDNDYLVGAHPHLNYGGAMLQEFDITTGYHVDVERLAVDVSQHTVTGQDVQVSTECGMLGVEPIHGQPVDLACHLKFATVSANQSKVYSTGAGATTFNQTLPWYIGDYFDTFIGRPLCMAPGLERFDLSMPRAEPVERMSADCGHWEIPPICYPGVPCWREVMHQYTAGLHRDSTPPQQEFDFDAQLRCVRNFLH